MFNAKKIRAVLFDCDGTLVDDLKVHRKLWPKVFKEFGLGKFNVDASRSVGKFLKKSGLSDEEIRKFWKRFNGLEFGKAPEIFRNANKLLEVLKQKGILTAIVTNRPTTLNYLNFLVQAGLYINLVDFFVNYDVAPPLVKLHPNHFSVSCGKPKPEILKPIIKILKRLPEFPKSVLMVGDSGVDLEFANRCDFPFVGVLTGLINSVKTWKKLGLRDQDVIIKNVVGLIQLFM